MLRGKAEGMNEVLKETLRRMNQAERLTGRGSWEWDVSTDKALWSEGMYHLFGVDPETFINSNENFLALVHPDDRKGLGNAMAAALAAPGPFRQEYRLIRPNGTTVFLRGDGDVLADAAGKPRLLYGFVQDVTKEKADEEKLRLANAELAKVSEFKSHFMSMVAHDLNNVLTPMRLNLKIVAIEEQKASGRESAHLTQVKAGVDRMEAFLGDLLDVVRLQSGRLTLHKDLFDLAQRLRATVEGQRAQAEAQGVKLDLQAPASLNLRGDAHRVEQVVSNLLSNAIKFTPSGGSVTVTLRKKQSEAQIAVRDTGRGISSEDQVNLFQPFSQVGVKVQGKHTGTGLGLFITRGIVEQHGGQVWVQSDGIGRGAVFEVRLPLNAAP